MSTRKNTNAKEDVACNVVEIFPASLLELLPRICSGIKCVPTTIGAANPTKRSAAAKFIRRKEVRFSLVRCFQNTNIVKRFPMKISKETKTATNTITREAVFDMLMTQMLLLLLNLRSTKRFYPKVKLLRMAFTGLVCS